MRYRILATTILGLLAGSFAMNAPGQSVVYETDFESSGDPSGVSYSTGDLDGQDSWTVDTGSASVADSPLTAPSGSQYVEQGVSSSISRTVSDNSSRILFRAWYYGEGSAQLQAPDAGSPVAAILGFRQEDASNFVIAAYDGTADAFVEPSPAILYSNTDWHKVIVSLNYTDGDYDIMVDDEPHSTANVFRDASVTDLNGFQSTTDTGSNIDRVGFFSSDGDYDGDGISDDDEMTMSGADPLDPAKPGMTDGRAVGDFNNSGCTDIQDFLILLDNWQMEWPGGGDPVMDVDDFLALLDNWQQGPSC